MWIKFKHSDCNYQYTTIDLSAIAGKKVNARKVTDRSVHVCSREMNRIGVTEIYGEELCFIAHEYEVVKK